MSRRYSRKELGDKVFECLTQHEPTLQEALKITGLSAAQWHSGLTYIREVLAEINAEPVVWNAKTKTYALASFPAEVDAYIGRRVNSFLIALRRIYDGSFWPAGVKFQTKRTRQFHEVDQDVHRLITRLEEVLDDLKIPQSEALIRRKEARAAAGLT